jgi:hypothetical protein
MFSFIIVISCEDLLIHIPIAKVCTKMQLIPFKFLNSKVLDKVCNHFLKKGQQGKGHIFLINLTLNL